MSVVQYVLIDLLRDTGKFPISWFAITGSILIAAAILHYICKGILFIFNKLINRVVHTNANKAKT